MTAHGLLGALAGESIQKVIDRVGGMKVPRRLSARGRAATIDTSGQGALNRQLLSLLVITRFVAVACGFVVVLALSRHTTELVPLLHVAIALLAVGVLNYVALMRIRQRGRTSENEFLVHVAGDIAVLTYVLAQSGGADNPFAEFYMLPIALSAYALSWCRVLIVMALAVGGWLTMDTLHVHALPYPQSAEFTAHMLTGAMLAYFAYAVASISRSHERSVGLARERVLCARSAEAIGTVAANAAHRMSTPLGTMAVLVAELRQDRLCPADRYQALDTLAGQIDACKHHLSELLGSVGITRGEQGQLMSVDRLLQTVCDECELMDPAAEVKLTLLKPGPAPEVVVERSLFDALLLLIKHCVADSPHAAQVQADWKGNTLSISITNPGAHPALRRRMRINAPLTAPTQSPATEQVMLASTIVERFGGQVVNCSDAEGKWFEVILPLEDQASTRTSDWEV